MPHLSPHETSDDTSKQNSKPSRHNQNSRRPQKLTKCKKGKQNKRVTLTTNMVPSQQVLIVKGQVNIKEE